MLRAGLALFFIFFFLLPVYAVAEDQPPPAPAQKPKNKHVSFEYELDPYYSNVGLLINLTDKPIPDAGEAPELEVYKQLLFSSFIPRAVILEAAIFPMPDLGVAIRDKAPEFYSESEVINNFNLVKAITAGFEEPYALSLFAGNVMSFTRPDEKKKHGNFGYMGYLISVSDYHIKSNRLIEDKSVELEWKIKGDRKFSTHTLHWSFRIGEKLHSNRDIKDVIYIALRRSLLDFAAPSGSLSSILENSGFEYIYDMDNKNFKPVRHYFTVDKKWPYSKKRMGFSLALGFIWEGAQKYTGALADIDGRNNFQVVLRPNIQF